MNDLATTDFNVVLLVFRVLFGLTFAAHGYAKRFQGGRLAGTAKWFDSMGMRPGRIHAEIASLAEIGAGLGLALGLFTPLAAAACVGVMVVAGYTVHRGKFFIVKDGWEYTFVVALIAVTIAGLGPGELVPRPRTWSGRFVQRSHRRSDRARPRRARRCRTDPRVLPASDHVLSRPDGQGSVVVVVGSSRIRSKK